MNYNLKRHIELLKLQKNLTNQGKNFFLENIEEDVELSNYNIAVFDHMFWQYRYEVSLFLEDFLNNKIDAEELCGRVSGLRRELINDSEKFNLALISGSEIIEKLKDFQPDVRSKNMSGLLRSLYYECEYFAEDYENDEFYTLMKNAFLNFQKALNKE